MGETQLQKDLSLQGSWHSLFRGFNNVTQPTRLIFAQFEPHLAVVDDRDGVTVWDWSKNKKTQPVLQFESREYQNYRGEVFK